MQNRLGKLGKTSQQENFHRVEFFRKILHKICMCRLNCSVPRSLKRFQILLPNNNKMAQLQWKSIYCIDIMIFRLSVFSRHPQCSPGIHSVLPASSVFSRHPVSVLPAFIQCSPGIQTGNIYPLLCCLIPVPLLAPQQLGLALSASAEMSETPILPLQYLTSIPT